MSSYMYMYAQVWKLTSTKNFKKKKSQGSIYSFTQQLLFNNISYVLGTVLVFILTVINMNSPIK